LNPGDAERIGSTFPPNSLKHVRFVLSAFSPDRTKCGSCIPVAHIADNSGRVITVDEEIHHTPWVYHKYIPATTISKDDDVSHGLLLFYCCF
jgi:hypothetical protein